MYSLTGPPGCGKSTQAELLKDKGFASISAGALLRSKAPQHILDQMVAGELADHDYTNKLMHQEIDRLRQTYKDDRILIDGYPRSLVQARWLLEDYGATLKACMILKADEDELIARLLDRGRIDDTEDSIRQRLGIFNHNIKQVVHYYQKHQISIFYINALDTIENIHLEIKEILNID